MCMHSFFAAEQYWHTVLIHIIKFALHLRLLYLFKVLQLCKLTLAVSLKPGAIEARLTGAEVVPSVSAACASGKGITTRVVSCLTKRRARLRVLIHQHTHLQIWGIVNTKGNRHMKCRTKLLEYFSNLYKWPNYFISQENRSKIDTLVQMNLFKIKVKSSMARSLPVENLLPQNVGSIINYLQ